MALHECLPIHGVARRQVAFSANSPRPDLLIPLSGNDKSFVINRQFSHSSHRTVSRFTAYSPINRGD